MVHGRQILWIMVVYCFQRRKRPFQCLALAIDYRVSDLIVFLSFIAKRNKINLSGANLSDIDRISPAQKL